MLPNIQFYGGIQGIGGNQILVVASNNKAALLDFGFDFGISGLYFDGFMKIREKQALVDALKIGMMPWPTGDCKGIYREDLSKLNQEWIQACFNVEFREKSGNANILDDLTASPIVTDLLLTHAHLDHVGAVRYLHPSINIVCSETTKVILERLDIVGGASSTFNDIVSYKPIGGDQEEEDDSEPNGADTSEQTTDSGQNSKKSNETSRKIIAYKEKQEFLVADGGLRVQLWPVDHSIPGAVAFLIEDVQTHQRLIYTGDFRLHGPCGELTKIFITAAKKFAPHSLIIEGTRITPDPSPEPPLMQIDGRKNELQNENDVKMHMIEFLKFIQIKDPQKLVCFNCSIRDLWRIGTLYAAAKASGRILVVDSKVYDLLTYLDPDGTKFNIDKTQIKVYLPRKDSGLYRDKDYAKSPSILEVFKNPSPDIPALLKEYNEERKTKYDREYPKKHADYEKKMADYEQSGKSGRKPNKPKSFSEKKEKDLPNYKFFWFAAPFRITAKEIHENQGRYLLFLSPYILNEYFDIQPDPGSYYISSTSSPFDEEGVLDERRRNNWFKLFNIPLDNGHIGNFHCSGHMAEADIFKTIETINPKAVYLVHSEGKSKFSTTLNGSIKGILPQSGTKYSFN